VPDDPSGLAFPPRQGPERDDVGRALGGVVDDGVEVDERAVARGVLIRRCREFGVVHAADHGMSAVRTARGVGDAAVPDRVVAHFTVVGTPRGQVGSGVGRVQRIKLVGEWWVRRERRSRGWGRDRCTPAIHLPRVRRREGIVDARGHVAVADRRC